METLQYNVILETKSPFRVGSRRDPFSGLDQPIVRIGDKYTVPGTTLKGALRELIERYLYKNYSGKVGMKPCIPASYRALSKDEKELINSGKYKGPGCHYPCKFDRSDRCTLTSQELWSDSREKEEGRHYICPTCYLLGAQGLTGFAIIPFLTAEITPSELPAIGLDRAKQTAAEGRGPRTYQIIPEGIRFEGTLNVLLKDDLRTWELGKPRLLRDLTLGDLWLQENLEWSQDKIIKDLLLGRLTSINVLGGLKSSGAGKVEMKVEGKVTST